MFTGIVEACVPVDSVTPVGTGLRVALPSPGPDWADVALGESVAVCGTCLTVAALEAGGMVFDLSMETVERTWFAHLEEGTRVNLERALRLSERLSGHIVQGHVDGGGQVVGIDDSGDGGRVFTFEVDAGLERYLIEKGSITLDGISLTVCEPVGRRFTVAVIPVTLEETNLGEAVPGQRLNVEVDVVGKWIERLLPG